MERYNYLIVGAGMSADAAVRGIRSIDFTSTIGVIGDETFPPYNRPPLTKSLWFGTRVEDIWRKTQHENVTLHLGRKVISINPETHIVTDHVGNTYWYDKLLLATGGIPNKLTCPSEGVIYYRSLKDYNRLKELYDKGNDFVVIGSGFIATEIAAALTLNGKKVTMVFNEPSLGFRKYPKGFSKFLSAFYTEKGVQLFPSQTITRVSKKSEKYELETNNGERMVADGVIAGLGITPATELAKTLNLEINNGVVVDRYLQTSKTGIYACGDIANFYSPHLETRVRIDHEDAANSTGYQAGRNMAGAKEHFTYLPYFYSDIFELGYEAIGEIDSTMETVEDWQDLNRIGAIYYLKEGKLKGAVLWGIWHQIDKIREMIASKKEFSRESLLGSVF